MSFFKKKSEKKKPRETNEIENRQLKEKLADAAPGFLNPGEDYNALNHTKVRFGYLFQVEDRGIQAVSLIMTDKTTAYFYRAGIRPVSLEFYRGRRTNRSLNKPWN